MLHHLLALVGKSITLLLVFCLSRAGHKRSGWPTLLAMCPWGMLVPCRHDCGALHLLSAMCLSALSFQTLQWCTATGATVVHLLYSLSFVMMPTLGEFLATVDPSRDARCVALFHAIGEVRGPVLLLPGARMPSWVSWH